MTTARKLKVADNLTQVAHDLIDYILKPTRSVEEQEAHRQALLGILGAVKGEYEKTVYNLPLIYLIEEMVHWYSRQRGNDIRAAQAVLSEANAGDALVLLDVFAGLLQHGNCDSTSANSLLFNKLIEKLDRYEPLEIDERLNKLGRNTNASKMGVREALRDVFVAKAKETIQSYQEEIEAINRINLVKKPVVNKLQLNPQFKNQLEGVFGGNDTKTHAKRDAMVSGVSLLKRATNGFVTIDDYHPDNTLPPVDASIKNKYAGLMVELERIFDKTNKKQEVEEGAFEAEAKRLGQIDIEVKQALSSAFLHARKNIGRFFHAKESAVSEDVAVSLPHNKI